MDLHCAALPAWLLGLGNLQNPSDEDVRKKVRKKLEDLLLAYKNFPLSAALRGAAQRRLLVTVSSAAAAFGA